jgi:hypothetical protein
MQEEKSFSKQWLDGVAKNGYNLLPILKRVLLGNGYWGIGKMKNTKIKGLTLWMTLWTKRSRTSAPC